jgi:hypothetical protein
MTLMKNLKTGLLGVLTACALMVGLHSSASLANGFKIGETVFVEFPAGNIKDDAFIVGTVTELAPNGDYQIAVIDFVEGHDYGVSCVPMAKKQNDQGYGEGWAMWTDTKTLNSKELQYRVPKENVVNLNHGKQNFVERNNLYIVFGRWKSDAPMLTIDRLERAKNEANAVQLNDLNEAFDIAIAHRASFYGDFGRPYLPFETIAPLNQLVEKISTLLANDAVLKALWQAKTRDWPTISKNTRHYFLIEAMDKSLADAQSQLYKEGVDKADAVQMQSLKTTLSGLQRAQ